MRRGYSLALMVNLRIFKYLKKDRFESARSVFWQADCDLTSMDMAVAHINGGSLSRRQHKGCVIICLGVSG